MSGILKFLVKHGIVPLIITNIADKCFLKCPFQSIQLNTRVTSIGECCFMESRQLTSRNMC